MDPSIPYDVSNNVMESAILKMSNDDIWNGSSDRLPVWFDVSIVSSKRITSATGLFSLVLSKILERFRRLYAVFCSKYSYNVSQQSNKTERGLCELQTLT